MNAIQETTTIPQSTTQNTPWFQRSIQLLVRTDGSVASLVARLTLAAVMFPHGAQKLLGWFGGYGFSGTYGFMTSKMGLPGLVVLFVILAEFFAPLMLAAGALSRAAALAIGGIMLGAMFTVHTQYGFFMNWSGKQAGEGFEYHLLALALAAVVVITGGGLASIDRIWQKKLTQ